MGRQPTSIFIEQTLFFVLPHSISSEFEIYDIENARFWLFDAKLIFWAYWFNFIKMYDQESLNPRMHGGVYVTPRYVQQYL